MANFCARLAQTARRFPNRPAIEMAGPDGVVTTTYADLLDRSSRYAAWLADTAGVMPGDRVAILAANDTAWIAAYLGILRLGAVAVPLDTAYAIRQIQTIVDDCQARVLFVSDRLHDLGLHAAAEASTPTQVVRLTMALDATRTNLPIADVNDGDAAAILYTSGTTADPKGVVLTHANLEAERAGAFGVVHVTEDDAVLGVLPLFHALAQMANLLLPLSVGARVVFLESINSTTLIDALDARGITVFACVPQFFYLIHQRVIGEITRRGRIARAAFRALIEINVRVRDTVGLNPGRWMFRRVHRALGSRMRLLITGGSRFDPAIARDLYGLGLTLLNGYGLTETSGAATVMRPGDRFTTSVGHPLPGVDVRIDVDNTGAATEDTPGTGEILIRGGVVMREYFHRPDATADVLDRGWLRTGDLGRMDGEGRVYVTGRRKEVIVLSSGKNLYPEELEAHYRQSAFIRELCVLGLTEPGAPSAERLHAVVVPDEAALLERGTVNLRELVRFELEELSVQLPAHKRILSYDIAREPLPRTTTGKLKRQDIEREIRTRATVSPDVRPLSAEERRWLEADRHGAIVAIIAARLGREVIHPDDNLELDLQLDSMERVELLAALERHQGTQVAPETRATIFTVRQLVAAVSAAPSSGVGASPDAEDAPSLWTDVLAGAPDPVVVRDLSRPTLARALVLYTGLRMLMALAALGLERRQAGSGRLPANGPCIISPNHQSYLDGFLVAGALPFHLFRQLFFVGAAEYFQTPLMKRLARLANIVPVDPDAHLVNAMRAAAAGLQLGKVLILFPEGERTIDGQLRPFRKGAAILASHAGVPIVPAAIDGTFIVWPRGRAITWSRLRPWRRVPVTLRFADPIIVAPRDYDRGIADVRAAVVSALASTPAARPHHGTD